MTMALATKTFEEADGSHNELGTSDEHNSLSLPIMRAVRASSCCKIPTLVPVCITEARRGRVEGYEPLPESDSDEYFPSATRCRSSVTGRCRRVR